MTKKQQYIAPTQLLVFTGSVFDNSSLSPKKYNAVLETLPYQRYPEDKTRSKLCALDHRQKEVYARKGRSARYRFRSDHIEPRSLNCVAKEVLFFI